MISELYATLAKHRDGAPLVDGRYRVLATLGSGRFAKVKLCWNNCNYSYQAIKILRSNASEDDLRQFVNEISISSYLAEHVEEIANIRDANLNGLVCKNGRQPKKIAYYIMDLAMGGELFSIFERGFRLSENTAKFLFSRVFEALNHLHNRGVAHRDIKGENILFGEDMSIKLCDFGCSSNLDGDYRFRRSPAERDESIGSPEFNAPEIWNPREFRSFAKSDIFSAGCLLFQAVMNKFPFNTSKREDQLYRKLRLADSSNYWNFFNCNPSKEFRDLIEIMLSSNPDDRPTISEILSHPWFKKDMKIDVESAEAELKGYLEITSQLMIEKINKQLSNKNYLRFKGIPMRRSRPGSACNFDKPCERFLEEYREEIDDIVCRVKSRNRDSLFESFTDSCNASPMSSKLFSSPQCKTDLYPGEDSKLKLQNSENKNAKGQSTKLLSISDWLKRCSSTSSASSYDSKN